MSDDESDYYINDFVEVAAYELRCEIELIDDDDEGWPVYDLCKTPFNKLKSAVEDGGDKSLKASFVPVLSKYFGQLFRHPAFPESFYDSEEAVRCCHNNCKTEEYVCDINEEMIVVGLDPEKKNEKDLYPLSFIAVCLECYMNKTFEFSRANLAKDSKEYKLMEYSFYEMLACVLRDPFEKEIDSFEGSMESKGKQILEYLATTDVSQKYGNCYYDYYFKVGSFDPPSLKRERSEEEEVDDSLSPSKKIKVA